MSSSSDSEVRASGWDDSLYEEKPRAATPDRGESTDAAGGGHRRTGKRPRRSRKARIIRATAIAVSLAVLGGSGAVWAYYEHLNSQIVKGKRASGESSVKQTKANAAGQTPMNILLLGSDSRNSAENLKLGGAKYTVGDKPRADVIMLMHLSADRKNMSVISIPRDTRVPIPKCTDPDSGKTYPATDTAIINESLTRGGAGCTLATVQNLTSTYIDHWMVIDFAGVVKMADAIGGVEVCVNQNVYDHPTSAQPGGSYLKLKAGRQEVTGKKALQWLRTRHAWGSDVGRAKAQHMYMTSMMRKLRKQNIFTDTGHLMDLAEAATSSLKVSEELGSIKKLFNLGMQLKTVPNNRITMLTMPTLKDPQNPEAHLIPGPDASKIWSMVRNDIAFDANGKAKTGTGTASPAATTGATAAPAASIAVTVVNGTAGTAAGAPVNHRAGDLVTALKAAGFTKTVPDRTARPSEVTTLSYPAADGAQGKADALAVAKALDVPKASVKSSSQVSSITLTVGADWTEGTDYAKSLPSAGSSLANADAINGASTKDCMDVYAPYQWS